MMELGPETYSNEFGVGYLVKNDSEHALFGVTNFLIDICGRYA